MASTKSIILLGLLGLFLARLGIVFNNFYKGSQFKEHFELSDEKCELAGMDMGMFSSEDMVLGKYGILFITSGDLRNTFDNGPTKANTGNIFMMNMNNTSNLKKLDIVKANIHSSPFSRKNFRFQPHGMDISNTTDRLYVTNHNKGYSSVIIFDIKYNMNCLKKNPQEGCLFENTASLVFKAEVRSELFPVMALNDVVEVSETEFYVTQWLPYGFPKRGAHNPETMQERLEVLANNHYAILLFNYKWTTVFHCKWDMNTKPVCKVATEEKFLMANGITSSPDGKTVFVNDVLGMNIMALSRDENTGLLAKKFDIPLPTLVDNIDYDDEANEILLGSIIPGGLAVAVPEKDSWSVKGVLTHDEKKLKQISVGARLGNSKIVLGTPFSEGILVCIN